MNKKESSFPRRVLAAGIDFMFVFSLGFIGILFIAKGGITLEELSRTIEGIGSGGANKLIGQVWTTFLGINLAYYLSEILLGASLGKFITGISIRSSGGERASLRILAIRYCLKHSPGLLSVAGIITAWSLFDDVQPVINAIVIISFLIAAVTRHHMAGYDMVAGTNVFYNRLL